MIDAFDKIRFPEKLLKFRKVTKILFIIGVGVFFISLVFLYFEEWPMFFLMIFFVSVFMIPSSFLDYFVIRSENISSLILISSLYLVIVLVGCVAFLFIV